MEHLWIVFAVCTGIEAFILFAMVREGNPRADQLKDELREQKKVSEHYRELYEAERQLGKNRMAQNVFLTNLFESIASDMTAFEEIKTVCDAVRRDSRGDRSIIQ